MNAASAKPAPLGNAIQRAGQLCARRLKFKNKLLQILVLRILEAQFVAFVPELHRALETAMLERMPEVAIGGANPVNAFPMRLGFGRRFVQRLFASAIHFLDPTAVFRFGLFARSTRAVPAHFLRDFFLGLG